MALDEQDVAGEDGAVLRHVDQDVAPRMRRPDILEQHLLVADLELQLVLEHPRRRRVPDVVPLELAAHHLVQEGAGLAELAPVALHGRQLLGRPLLHLLGAGARSDDLGAGHELVAESVVAVGVGVDQATDRPGRRHRGAHLPQHLAGQFEVEQRIDQQCLVAIDDQSGIAEAPAAVGLQPGETAVAEVVQALGVLPFRHVVLPHCQRRVRPGLKPSRSRPGRSRRWIWPAPRRTRHRSSTG